LAVAAEREEVVARVAFAQRPLDARDQVDGGRDHALALGRRDAEGPATPA
jgi:hypothetical protein